MDKCVGGGDSFAAEGDIAETTIVLTALMHAEPTLWSSHGSKRQHHRHLRIAFSFNEVHSVGCSPGQSTTVHKTPTNVHNDLLCRKGHSSMPTGDLCRPWRRRAKMRLSFEECLVYTTDSALYCSTLTQSQGLRCRSRAERTIRAATTPSPSPIPHHRPVPATMSRLFHTPTCRGRPWVPGRPGWWLRFPLPLRCLMPKPGRNTESRSATEKSLVRRAVGRG